MLQKTPEVPEYLELLEYLVSYFLGLCSLGYLAFVSWLPVHPNHLQKCLHTGMDMPVDNMINTQWTRICRSRIICTCMVITAAHVVEQEQIHTQYGVLYKHQPMPRPPENSPCAEREEKIGSPPVSHEDVAAMWYLQHQSLPKARSQCIICPLAYIRQRRRQR